MIRSFLHRGLERLFLDGVEKGIQPNHVPKVSDILDQLDAATRPGDLGFPGSHLHPLKGKWKGWGRLRYRLPRLPLGERMKS